MRPDHETAALIAVLAETMRKTRRIHEETRRLSVEIHELGNWRRDELEAHARKIKKPQAGIRKS